MNKFIRKNFLINLFAGCLLSLSFAPFSLHGMAIISLSILCYRSTDISNKAAMMTGIAFGLGFFGTGVSWVIVSIHDFGGLNYPIAAIATLLFILYLSLFICFVTMLYAISCQGLPRSIRPLSFACLWVLGEWLRAHLFTGFPWLMTGYSQLDTPLQWLIPITGNYGVTFLIACCAGLLALSFQIQNAKRYIPLISIITFYLCAYLLPTSWVELEKKPLKVGIIQANMAMRDKWDSQLFWQLVDYYEKQSKELLAANDVVIWPESAIPIEASRLKELLQPLNQLAKKNHTAIVLGAPDESPGKVNQYTNSMITLGDANGRYDKQHLVPFGEYLPGKLLHRLFQWLDIPLDNLASGKSGQSLVTVKNSPVASLICYEVGYAELLRQQLPKAQFIVTISDDGWFGHSFAMYQHLEMARFNSLLTGRFQIVANNNGLSTIIDDNGQTVSQLKPFVSENLSASIYPAKGVTPWTMIGDNGVIVIISLLAFILCLLWIKRSHRISRIIIQKTIADSDKRGYP